MQSATLNQVWMLPHGVLMLVSLAGGAAVLHVTANLILHYIHGFVRCTCSICLLDQPVSLILATVVTPSQTAQVLDAVGVRDAASAQHVCSLPALIAIWSGQGLSSGGRVLWRQAVACRARHQPQHLLHLSLRYCGLTPPQLLAETRQM